MKLRKYYAILLSLILILSLTGCDGSSILDNSNTTTNTNNYNNQYTESTPKQFDFSQIPEYSGSAIYVVNNNVPFFTKDEMTTESYESYSELDSLGRCGVAIACLSKDTMPAEGETRGEIGNVKPAGWHTIKYPDLISDLYLYNRCHLIGWQLGAENDNVKNLTTGTRYLNVEGMLPYENLVDNYIEATNNHVMYRITPIFIGNELVCRGILMEAKSVEDNSCIFCIYCYNVQPGINIDYATGESNPINNTNVDITDTELENDYILNTSSMKIHRPDCVYAVSISEKNRYTYIGVMKDLIDQGYSVCKTCNPQ